MALEGLPRETQVLSSLPWSFPTKLLSLETQGELQAANKVGEEREEDGGGKWGGNSPGQRLGGSPGFWTGQSQGR